MAFRAQLPGSMGSGVGQPGWEGIWECQVQRSGRVGAPLAGCEVQQKPNLSPELHSESSFIPRTARLPSLLQHHGILTGVQAVQRCQESWGHFWSASSAGPPPALPRAQPSFCGIQAGSSDTLKHKLSSSLPSGGWTKTITSSKQVPACHSLKLLFSARGSPLVCTTQHAERQDQQMNKQLHPGCPQIQT